jgi:NAD(P)-dependent dehydrogenase (short-subunit alcohol dehydrogenase family)
MATSMSTTAARFDLTGRAALVTGASSGLGWRFAEVLAEAGAKVAIAARRTDRLEALAAAIAARGGTALPIALDITHPPGIRAAIASAESELGPLRILVSNSGIAPASGFLDHSEEDWDRTIDTNLKGTFLVGQEAARLMAAHGQGGSIVNIASMLGLIVAKGSTAYSASKAGVISLTKTMALELARHRIRVNAICPGYFETEMTEDYLSTPQGQAMIKAIPMRRVGKAEELDGLLLLLASDASSFMTGSCILVDGGEVLQQA